METNSIYTVIYSETEREGEKDERGQGHVGGSEAGVLNQRMGSREEQGRAERPTVLVWRAPV